MAIPKKIIVTVGGVPFDELTEEHKRKIIKRNTDIVAEMVTRDVVKMAEEGKSIQEILPTNIILLSYFRVLRKLVSCSS